MTIRSAATTAERSQDGSPCVALARQVNRAALPGLPGQGAGVADHREGGVSHDSHLTRAAGRRSNGRDPRQAALEFRPSAHTLLAGYRIDDGYYCNHLVVLFYMIPQDGSGISPTPCGMTLQYMPRWSVMSSPLLNGQSRGPVPTLLT